MVCDEIDIRRALDREPRVGKAETIHPGDFGKQPDHLPKGQQDTDEKHPDDESVEPRIRQKCRPDLTVQYNDEQPAENKKNQHPHQEDTWG
jgi:hypothetical protein